MYVHYNVNNEREISEQILGLEQTLGQYLYAAQRGGVRGRGEDSTGYGQERVSGQ
jgi:hypothetical protein